MIYYANIISRLIQQGIKYLIVLPLYHIGGMSVGATSPINSGLTVVFPCQAFDAKLCLEAAHSERTTLFGGIPTMVIAMLSDPDFTKYDLSSTSVVVMGGAPCPVDLMKRLEETLNIPALTIYGLTEASPLITVTKMSDTMDQLLYTVGSVADHVEVCVKDPRTGRIVPRGTTGEVCSRGFNTFKGYWDDEEKTRQIIDESNWLHSGDLGIMDEDGYLSIVGRSKDMIIRGGVNIYPAEIEQFLHTHPKIIDVYVIGVPDDYMGEELCACIHVKDGETLTEDDVKVFCKGNIAHFKIPRYVQFQSEFPMTVTGKVQKFKLQDEMTTKLGLQK